MKRGLHFVFNARFLRPNFTGNFGTESDRLFHRKENKNEPSSQQIENELAPQQQ